MTRKTLLVNRLTYTCGKVTFFLEYLNSTIPLVRMPLTRGMRVRVFSPVFDRTSVRLHSHDLKVGIERLILGIDGPGLSCISGPVLVPNGDVFPTLLHFNEWQLLFGVVADNDSYNTTPSSQEDISRLESSVAEWRDETFKRLELRS